MSWGLDIADHLKAAAAELEAAARLAQREEEGKLSGPAITIKSIYGREVSELPPDGFDWLIEDGRRAFRKPQAGEWVLNAASGRPEAFLVRDLIRWGPKEFRLILTQKLKPRRWVFEETGEIRAPKFEEYFIDYVGAIGVVKQAMITFESAQFPIIRLVERPE